MPRNLPCVLVNREESAETAPLSECVELPFAIFKRQPQDERLQDEISVQRLAALLVDRGADFLKQPQAS